MGCICEMRMRLGRPLALVRPVFGQLQTIKVILHGGTAATVRGATNGHPSPSPRGSLKLEVKTRHAVRSSIRGQPLRCIGKVRGESSDTVANPAFNLQ